MKISEEIIWLAEKRIEDIPILKNSIRGKEANLIGSIGEVLFEKFIQDEGLMIEKETGEYNQYNHDFIVNKMFTVDVKTKDRTVPPKDYYDCTVPVKNLGYQNPDFFYFISLLREGETFTEGFLLGAINLPNLKKKGEIWMEGDIDVRNGKRIRNNCINVTVKNLLTNDEFLTRIREVYGWNS